MTTAEALRQEMPLHLALAACPLPHFHFLIHDPPSASPLCLPFVATVEHLVNSWRCPCRSQSVGRQSASQPASQLEEVLSSQLATPTA